MTEEAIVAIGIGVLTGITGTGDTGCGESTVVVGSCTAKTEVESTLDDDASKAGALVSEATGLDFWT